jgi:hypothetical protein
MRNAIDKTLIKVLVAACSQQRLQVGDIVRAPATPRSQSVCTRATVSSGSARRLRLRWRRTPGADGSCTSPPVHAITGAGRFTPGCTWTARPEAPPFSVRTECHGARPPGTRGAPKVGSREGTPVDVRTYLPGR